jgi:hypothetical protein
MTIYTHYSHLCFIHEEMGTIGIVESVGNKNHYEYKSRCICNISSERWDVGCIEFVINKFNLHQVCVK